jgi:hypothetical protein
MFETTNQHIIAYYSMIIDTRWTSSFRTWLDGSNTLHMLSWWCLQCREYLPVEKSSKSSLAEILAQFRVPAIIFPPQSQASFRHHSGLLKSSRTKYVDRTLLLILEFLWYVWICLNNFGYHHQRYPETSKVSIGLQASAVSSCQRAPFRLVARLRNQKIAGQHWLRWWEAGKEVLGGSTDGPKKVAGAQALVEYFKTGMN